MMQSPHISSLQNPQIKHLLHLRTARYRRQYETLIVDGVLAITRAMQSQTTIRQVFWCPERDTDGALRQLCQSHKISVTTLAEPVYRKIAYGDWNDGWIATAAYPPTDLDRLSLSATPLVVVATQLEKPGNLGAILRSADGVGADAVIVADPVMDMFNPNVVRASLGTVFTVPCACGNHTTVQDWLVQNQMELVVATPDARQLYWETDLTGALALVVGNEHAGIPAPWCAVKHTAVKIPMLGLADSLNVSVSTAVILYEACRQRNHVSTGQ